MSEEMGIFETMYNCRAMRRLDSREVPQATLEKLIEAANQAPSGSNTQNARWIVVRDPAVKAKLAELNRKGVESYLAPLVDNPGSLLDYISLIVNAVRAPADNTTYQRDETSFWRVPRRSVTIQRFLKLSPFTSKHVRQYSKCTSDHNVFHLSVCVE